MKTNQPSSRSAWLAPSLLIHQPLSVKHKIFWNIPGISGQAALRLAPHDMLFSSFDE